MIKINLLQKLLEKDEKPYVQTFTAVLGSKACNAACEYCIAEMTPSLGLTRKLPETNWTNFERGAKQANQWGASTALLTSKGELTLYPKQTREFLDKLVELDLFAQTEIQTNAIQIAKPYFDEELDYWRKSKVTTVAISIGHYDSKKNAEVVIPRKGEDAINLNYVIKKIRDHGMSVRLSAMMLKGYLDSVKELNNLIDFAKKNDVQQVTARPISRPYETEFTKVADFVDKNKVEGKELQNIVDYYEKNSQGKRNLVHGATIYYINGGNLCLSNCLTGNSNKKGFLEKFLEKRLPEKQEAIRQVIYSSDGHIRTDWQYEGAILF